MSCDMPSRLILSAFTDIRCLSRARANAIIAEEVCDLDSSRLGGVRTMHDVFLDALGKVGTNRSCFRISRVRGAHDLAVLGDGILALQRLHDDGTRRHVADEVIEERAFLVNGVKSLRLLLAEVHHASGYNFQSGFFETAVDLSDQVFLHTIRLDDGERLLNGHV